jgi:integrase
MDTKNLRENHLQLISYMENAAYRQNYVRRFKREIQNILHLADSGKISCYDDAYRRYEQIGFSKNTMREKRLIIEAIKRFDQLGQYPDGSHKLPLKRAYQSLCGEYKAIVDYFAEVERKRGIKESSIHGQQNNASVFLLELQKVGIEHLSDVTEEAVLSVFVASDGRIVRHYAWKKQIAAVLKTCIAEYPDCAKALAFLPAFRNKRKNIQYLTVEEVSKIKKALSDNSSNLKLRDRAIGTLALYTGLRCCDIAGLTMDSVDFDYDLLCVCQQKTEAPLELPLSAIVGNAIYDYIETERPKTNDGHVFVSQNAPFGRLTRATIGDISSEIMKAAGIRQKPGDRQGFHIFRHHLLTALLGNGVPRPVVSNIAGHISPDSLDTYLSADFPHLKECAISIEDIPVAPEVFAV